MAGSIQEKRSGVTGVSSDEELTYLIKFQQAYNASARYINVIDEMLEHVIERLG
jgi:flagellar hook-associated protein 1 FlgK